MKISANVADTIQRGGHEITLVSKEVVPGSEDSEYGPEYEETERTVVAVQDETQTGRLERDQRETSPNTTRVYYVSTEEEVPITIEDGGGGSATEVEDTGSVWVVTDYDNLGNGVYRLLTRRVS